MSSTNCRDESELYILWKSVPAPGFSFRCVDGEKITVISHGRLNTHSGPDFQQAVLLLNGALVAGSVEMHRRENEWFQHGHHHDPAYGDVLLHVVGDPPGTGSTHRPPCPRIDRSSLLRQLSSHHSGHALDTRDIDIHARADLKQLLTDLSWQRLLRRVTLLMRADQNRTLRKRVNRALAVGLLDGLGFSRNREPMRWLANEWIERGMKQVTRLHGRLPERTDVAEWLLENAGLTAIAREQFVRSMGPGTGTSESQSIQTQESRGFPLNWEYGVRPANAPHRRLVAASEYLSAITSRNFAGTLLQGIRSGSSFRQIQSLLGVRRGEEVFVGQARTGELVVDVVLPLSLLTGLILQDPALLYNSLELYRKGPTLASNRFIQEIEARFNQGRSLSGAFFQQGGLELYQNYVASDRTGRSFLAERSTLYGICRAWE